MVEIINFMFKGFWHFVGCIIIFFGIKNFTLILWNKFWRHWNIRKHGYPLNHCNADGDFKK